MNDLNKIKNYCARREVCISEAKTKLLSWGLNKNDISSFITVLIEDKFIDEKRYAIAYVNDHYKIKKWGRNKIKSALLSKTIESNVIEVAIKTIDETIYLENITLIIRNKTDEIEKKKSSSKAANRKKIINHLLSKGYEFDLIIGKLI